MLEFAEYSSTSLSRQELRVYPEDSYETLQGGCGGRRQQVAVLGVSRVPVAYDVPDAQTFWELRCTLENTSWI